jgi:hypothetical protein
VIGGEGDFSASIRGIIGLGPVSIGGSLIGGDGISSARLESGGAAGAIKIRHDMIGGDGASSARLVVAGNLAAITVGGSVLGGEGASSANMNINNATGGVSGAIRIGGDVRGLAAEGALIFSRNGSIASVTIGGSLIGGTGLFAGGIIALEKLGPVVVRGDILGEDSQAVLIRAGGLLTLPVGTATNVALSSLTVAGDVQNLKVLGGFGTNNAPINGRVQIGAVAVGGDWIASTITAGFTEGPDGDFGTADDERIPAGPGGLTPRIASIKIKGEVVGSAAPDDHFGFVAAQIGAFRALGSAALLTSGIDLPIELSPLTGDVTVREIAP